LAVYGFFLLSGLLIARSAETTRSVIRFFWHRVLRILPAYWVSLVVVAFGFALLAYVYEHHGLGGFLSGSDSPFGFVSRNFALQLHQYSVDHELLHTPFTQTWNGSLYTLVYEFSCYIAVGLLAVFGVVRRATVIPVAAACVCFVISLLEASGHPISNIPFVSDPQMMNFAFFFFAGASLHAYADRLPMNDIIGGLASAAALATLFGGGWLIVGRVAFCLAIPWLATRLPFRAVGVKRDLSYGVYIYAFPVQQSLSEYGLQARGLFAYVLLSFIGAYALAWVSWHCVERPALSAKGWTPVLGRRLVLAFRRPRLEPQEL
jgi:peptidoglycan/LPS O-acetylase OafA/YrhL